MNERSRRPGRRLGLRLPASLLLSLLVHLVVLLTIEDWRRGEREAEAFRTRLRQVLRFEPERFTADGPDDLLRTEMEYRPAGLFPRPRLEDPSLPRQPAPPQDAPVALRRFEIAARSDTFRAGTEPDLVRSLAAAQARGDSIRRPLDLMRIWDLAQGRERALVRPDPDSRRHLTGFANLTRVWLRGAGGGRGLETLARFMRERTPLLVRVRPEPIHYFTTPELLRDPVHFLIQGVGLPRAGDWPLLQLAAEEKELLQEYLRGGGLLYIEGAGVFLDEAVSLLRELLPEAGGIRPIPAGHPIYHSFYSFPGGFPSEDKKRWDYLQDLRRSWDYPTPEVQVSQPQAPNIDPELAAPAAPMRNGLWGVSSATPWWPSSATSRSTTPGPRWNGRRRCRGRSRPSRAGRDRPWWPGSTWSSTPSPGRGASPAARSSRPGTATGPGWPPPVSCPSAIPPPWRPRQTSTPASTTPWTARWRCCARPLARASARGVSRCASTAATASTCCAGTCRGSCSTTWPQDPTGSEVEHGGASEGIELRLLGGRVATVTFGVSRLAVLSRVRLEVQPEQVQPEAWRLSFSDLLLEEVFLQEDEVPVE